ncbi:MAG: phosphoglycerate dehydrogenase [Solirubrobacterales bacterium]
MSAEQGERQRVLVTCRQMQNVMDQFRQRFEDAGVETYEPKVVQQPSEKDLKEMIGNFDGMIAGDDPLTASVLAHSGRLRIISKWGVGTDGIDTEAAAARGIEVTRTPNVFGEEVADVAFGYVVILARQLHRLHNSVVAGEWMKHEGRSLAGQTLGIVGLGDIGCAVARRGAGFGMELLGYDLLEPDAATLELGLSPVSLSELLAASDIVVLCCPLTKETRHMIDAESLAKTKRGVNLVNVARGPLIDEHALVDALRSGQVGAAGLDVFEEEPLPAASPLREFEQCVFGTHNGSNTREANLRASARAVDNVLAGLGAGS